MKNLLIKSKTQPLHVGNLDDARIAELSRFVHTRDQHPVPIRRQAVRAKQCIGFVEARRRRQIGGRHQISA